MKKSFISASIASVLAMASASALAAGPDFYGRLDLAVTNADNGTTTMNGKEGTVFENNFSHIGVKGSEKIADGFDIIYQMEFGVDNTTTSGKTFSARNTFLGLKTNAGTVLVGRNDHVFKQTEGGVDLFGNTNADIDRLIVGQERVADGIWYYSPKIADLVTLNATYLLKDNQTDTEEQQYALSATLGDKKLKAHNYYVAAAYMDGIANVEAYRVVGQVKLADFKLGGLFQNTESKEFSNMEGNSYFVNAAYNLNGVNLKAEYGKDEAGLGKYFQNSIGNAADQATFSDVNVQSITVGADYRLAKSTLIYGHYAMYEGDYKMAGAKVDLSDDNVFTVGVRYDF
ncbi:porin [Shewanella corallii]|uniref:Porin n=2 Tax=Shewanella TaxID=22 RepID=A0ABT0N1V3_9GAMM|nr:MULTISPECIES: porin [Shewanella]MCL1035788.1 porin [Shewanella submarina]MCL2912419.1 porin [Shewanella corallii]